MTKFHINKNGIPAICKAQTGNCPLGGNSNHFNNVVEAQAYIDNLQKIEHGLLPELTQDISAEWKEKFLRYSDFEEFAGIHAREIVSSRLFGTKDVFEKSKAMWTDLHYESSLRSLNELGLEEMINTVRNNIGASSINGWFREYNSDYKPKIEKAIITNPELRNASLNISYLLYKESTGTKISFNDFIESEVEVYRGGNFDFVEQDVFVSYSFDKKIAENFSKKIPGSIVISKKVKIRDTLGSLQTTGEAELMVRR